MKRIAKACAALLATLVFAAVLASAAWAAETVSIGSNSTQLQMGQTYAAPVTMLKATNLSEESAANAMLTPKRAILYPTEQGVKVQLSFGPVHVLGLTGWASQISVYQGTTYKNTETEAATILSTTTTDAGAVVPTSVEFTIPNACMESDGVYLSMYVDAMSGYVNAFLSIDYTKVQLGTSYSYTSGQGSGFVRQFGSYYLYATVTVTDDVISGVDFSYGEFEGVEGEANLGYCLKAINGMKESFNGISCTDYEAMENVDVVSNATYSSRALRDAVVDALGGTVTEEVVPDAPENVPAAGVYSITITDIADGVSHSVIGRANSQEKQPAVLTVYEDGSMTLTYTHVSGTTAEPLYVLGFNGYYNEDGTLVTTASSYKTALVDGYNVVTETTIPLAAKPAQTAKTSTYLYVPAMEGLSGWASGFYFEEGHFNADTTITLYWDTLTRTGDLPAKDSGTSQDQTKKQTTTKTVTKVTINKAKVTYAMVKKAIKSGATTVVLGSKVKHICAKAFKNLRVSKVIVKSKKLTKKSVRNAFKSSKVKRVVVPKAKKKAYKKIFTKKNCGKKVVVACS